MNRRSMDAQMEQHFERINQALHRLATRSDDLETLELVGLICAHISALRVITGRMD